jgi:hypothetical protein
MTEIPRSPGPNGKEVDAVEAYRAVRSHEVMLNQATSAFEHAVLVPLTALNGGAIVALLTLAGAVADKSPLPAGWLVGASMAWALGLIAAALAASCAFRQQRAINAAHRALRERVEQLVFSTDPDLLKALSGPKVDREQKRMEAEKYGRWFLRAWWISIGCFVLGAAFASFAVVFAA